MESKVIELNDEPEPSGSLIDFSNTEIAFSFKSDKELKKTAFLFKLMNNPTLVNISSWFALWAIKLHFPFAETIIKSTIFKQFVGGDSLLHSQKTIDKLYHLDTLTILDFGAEGKSKEEELDAVMHENLRAIEMAASNNSVPVISIKVTGLVKNEILEKLNSGRELNITESGLYEKLEIRLDKICCKAEELGVGVFIDAEESWIQKPIDDLAYKMMEYYNKDKVIVYNTYQFYQKSKINQLKQDHKKAVEGGYLLGAKLVRGAYMEKENKRALELSYESPIHLSKQATDSDYDEAVVYCLDHYETIGFCNSSHNLKSNLLMADLIEKRGLDKSHPHINFCQLYGMSDYITFNLANAGYNVAKYVPYGPVKEVIPYLIRRANENTSITGETSRELSLLNKEIARRGI